MVKKRKKSRAEVQLQLQEIILKKFEGVTLEESMKFGLWVGTSVMAFPILKGAREIITTMDQAFRNASRLVSAFNPMSPFFIEGWRLIYSMITGTVVEDIPSETSDVFNVGDSALVLLSALVGYYLIYHPRAVAELGTNIIGLGRMFIGGSMLVSA